MARLTLLSREQPDVTIIPDSFIDTYMGEANGEFVKVYLYLLRCMKKTPEDFSLLMIADSLNLTERDVLRALRYWEQKGLADIESDESGAIQSILFHAKDTSRPPAGKSKKTPGTLSSLAPENLEACQELGLIAEQYLKRPLSPDELQKIMYFYETLHFSADLIEYLFEHCVTIGNKSFRYIESVATSWADLNITTVEQAKAQGQHYRREYFAILKAFGIQNRTPIDLEVQYMKRWMDEYHFTPEVIYEACQRTISKTGKPVFAYADSILKNWKEHGILAKKDIAKLDHAHAARQTAKTAERDKAGRQPRPAARFNNFEQREEYDFNQLEKQLNCT